MSSRPQAPRHPPELDDPVWLARRYEAVGDMAVALELHVTRMTVRRARERLGIPSLPRGPRRGGRRSVATDETGPLILARFQRECRPGGPPASEGLLATRIRAASEARLAGDALAYEDALIGIASAAGLIHRQRRARAATP